MNGMLDVTKAIKTLEPFSNSMSFGDKDDIITMGDIVDYLKMQEPRLMTWQEVIGAVLECKPVYIEVQNSEYKEPGDDRWAMLQQYKDSLTNGMIMAKSSYIISEVFFSDDYSTTWRVWTSIPTKEQMKAAKWND